MPDLLVVQWARLGDLLHSRPLLARCRAAFPRSRISLSCDSRYRAIVQRFPELDGVLPVDLESIVGHCRHDATLPDAFATLQQSMLCNEQFDTLFNLTNHAGAVYFGLMAPAARRVGYGFEKSDLLTALTSARVTTEAEYVHIADAWKMLVDTAVPAEFRNIDSEHKIGKRVVIVCDAGASERSLDDEIIRACVRQAALANATEIALVGAQPSEARSDLCRDLRGRTNLGELHSVLNSATHVIGPDTGALHLAAALGCRTFGIYLNGADPRRTGPYTTSAWCVRGNLNDGAFRAHVVENVSRWLIGTHAVSGGGHEVFRSEWRGDRMVFRSQRLNEPRAALSELSVIIVEFGQVHYTDELLEMLLRDTRNRIAEIIVVSSGLDEADARHARERTGVTALVSQTPLSFAQANNWGVQTATRDWCFLLNDDCVTNAEVLHELYEARDSKLIVAPELRYWDGTLQSKGAVITDSGVVEIDDDMLPLPSLTPQAVSGAALLISKSVFQELGGFDTSFVNGYEDVDLCLRASEWGVTCAVTKQQLVHYRSSSPTRFSHDDENLAHLRQRWPLLFMRQASGETRTARAPLLLVSDVSAREAGPVVRWISPLMRCGLRAEIDFTWFAVDDQSQSSLPDALDAAVAVIIFRSVSNQEARAVIGNWQARTSGRLVHDADDLLIGRFPSSSPRAALRRAFESGVRELMSWATCCTAPNDALLSLHAIEHDRRHVLPSLPLPQHFAAGDRQKGAAIFAIGYAGGRAHLTDLAMIEPALRAFLDEHADARFYWWGAHPGGLATHPCVRRGGPWLQDYYAHLERIQRVPIDVWLVPLADAPHNTVRSPIKVYEYLAANSVAYFSAEEPYVSALSSADGGLLIENTTSAWLHALRNAYETRDTLRSRLAAIQSRDEMLALHAKLEQYEQLLHKLSLQSIRGVAPNIECEQ